MTQQPPPPDPAQKTNVLAIISLISAFFVSILAIILGHIALSQIKRTGEKGRGLALTGTILGYVFTFAGLVAIIIFAVVGLSLASNPAVLEDFVDDIDSSEQLDDSNPWDDTEAAEFCDQVYGFGDNDLDTVEHFEKLAQTAPDSELARQYERLAQIQGGEEEFTDELEAENQELLELTQERTQELCTE